jgi:predicted DNA repair protein MutK
LSEQRCRKRQGEAVATGLIALLDDVAGIAKVAASSLDDVGAQAAKAGAKAAGVVIDDAAVTPRYVVGFAADRELPIIGRIALGSLKNKLLFLLPAALLLSLFAPWLITPLLMIGGAYLCYEGTEKVYEAIWPHHAHHHEAVVGAAPQDPKALEDQKVRGAIQTDFILSAEIMAITLAALPVGSFLGQAVTLAVVAIAITVLVYGAVALIVKADDVGVSLALSHRPAPLRLLGRALVNGMPILLKILSIIGTAAMIWVGGGIIIHGLEENGLPAIGHVVHDMAEAVAHAVPALGGFLEWLVSAAAAGIFGLIIGAILIPLVQYVVAPLWHRLRGTQPAAQPSH